MTRRPRLLDLFCCEGGAAVGYHRAGFDVVGVDIVDRSNYPFDFIRADAITVDLDGFDAYHASPPCQAHTTMSNRHRGQGGKADSHVDLIDAVRQRLVGTGRPYVIENVPGARKQLRNPVVLTGGMFGLRVERPRLFESNVLLLAPPAARVVNPVGVYGKAHDGRRLFTRADGSEQRAAASLDEAREAMGMPWASWRGCAEAIPPAYTEHIGRQLLAALTPVPL
jgi:DNA (cytosine-5)-methyltransferase 1